MDLDSSYLRKVKKPMIEKRRRERMNHSLAKLKTIMMAIIKQQGASPPMTKLEKADILEMTVNYICQLKNQQRLVSMTTNALGYQAGYKACTAEAMNYLKSRGSMDTQQLGYLGNHLQNSTHGNQNIPNGEASNIYGMYPNEGHQKSFYGQQDVPLMDSKTSMTSQQMRHVNGNDNYTHLEINDSRNISKDVVWRPW